MIKINDVITYTATDYANAETVGEVDGTTFFVPQTILGEKALVKVNHVKKGVAYADPIKIIDASPSRVEPACRHFGKCGGCTLMHMRYEEQLAFKTAKVRRNLEKIGKISVGVLPCKPSKLTLRYRNKLSLPVGGKVGKVKIGMYKKGSHDIVDIPDCLLGGEWAQKLVKIFQEYLNSQRIAHYDEKNFSGEVRHLVARYVADCLLVTIVSNGQFRRDLSSLVQMLKAEFPKFGLFVNVNQNKNNVILGKETTHICGAKYAEGTHLGVKFRLQPQSFFQVNDGVKDGIYEQVKSLLDVSQTQVLVDCFSGIGVLTSVLCSNNYDTYAVEIETSAVADAIELKKLNNSPRLTNLQGDANVLLPKIAEENRGKVLSLVVDPPRKGLGETICRTILDAGFDNVVYVSCDSATLARDLALLSEKYAVDVVQPWDMFPQTAEVETVCRLLLK